MAGRVRTTLAERQAAAKKEQRAREKAIRKLQSERNELAKTLDAQVGNTTTAVVPTKVSQAAKWAAAEKAIAARNAGSSGTGTISTAAFHESTTNTVESELGTKVNTETDQVLSTEERLSIAMNNFSNTRFTAFEARTGTYDLVNLVNDAKEAGEQVIQQVDVSSPRRARSRFTPEPIEAKREPRPTWAKLQEALQGRIIPNELYEDGDNEYELTTYQLTLFMIEEGRLFNTRLNNFSQSIQNIADVEALGGIIVAQSAGTDEFYIDGLSFKTGVGSYAPLMTVIEFTVKSPYQADFVDYIFKAAERLKVRNYTDFPLHLLIEFKGRNAKTSEAHTFKTSRCYALMIQNMDLQVDESGGSYAVRAYRASERGLGQDKVYLKKDITISGETVGEVLQELVGRLQNTTAKEERNVWVPDVYKIEIPAKWQDWPVRTPQEQKYSSKAMDNNGTTADAKSVDDITGSQATVIPHANSANSIGIGTTQSQKYLNESQMVRTFVFKTGTDILKAIQDVLNTAADFQQLVVDNEFDLQAPDAMEKRTTPENIWKRYAKMDVDVEYIGYDKNTRQYACKRIYQVIEHVDPILGANEETTQQTKETSTARLYNMLGAGFIEKAYLYYYTGLNTEIKSVDLSFDNHYIMAKALASKKGGSGKKQHGTLADSDTDIAVGATSVKFNELHDKYEQHIGAIAGDIIELDKKLDTIATDVRMNMYSDTKAQADNFNNATTIRAIKQAQLNGLKQYQGITEAQLNALEAGKLQIHFEGTYTDDAGKLIMDAGRFYFTETVQKIMPNKLTYMGDLQKKTDDGVMFPVKSTNTNTAVRQTGTNEDAHQAGNYLSEIIAQRMGANMVKLSLELRGDPYWLPENMSGNNKNSISPAFRQPMLIIIASQVSDHNAAGLFQVNERNSISAVYNVLNVVHTFSGGEFLQTLTCARDPQIDINAVLRAPDKFIEYNAYRTVKALGPAGIQ